MAALIRRRLLCTSAEAAGKMRAVREVTKANFAEAVEEFKEDLAGSDFVAVSLQKTGSFSAGWHRELPFDTNDTAYLKAKYAAERFQVLQFAACPFSLKASKLTAHPLVHFWFYCIQSCTNTCTYVYTCFFCFCFGADITLCCFLEMN